MEQHAHHMHSGGGIAQWVPLLLVLLLATVYLAGVLHLKNRQRGWNSWRTGSFIFGLVLLGISVAPRLMAWAHADLRGHMVQHLLLGMFGPIFLVLGAPVTLALKTLPRAAARGLATVLGSRVFHVITHPVTAFVLNIGGMYLLYLTPLYNAGFTKPYLHVLIHVHFLAAGYLFTWSIIGPDPAPNRPGLRLRVGVLFVSIAAHAFLSKYMYAKLLPHNSPHSAEQIQEAAKLMYYWGDLSELVLVVAVFALWYYKRGRPRYSLSPLIS